MLEAVSVIGDRLLFAETLLACEHLWQNTSSSSFANPCPEPMGFCRCLAPAATASRTLDTAHL
jgi:hypothetical protein